MEAIFWILLAVFIGVSIFIIPWFNLYRYGDLKHEIRNLKTDIYNLRRALKELKGQGAAPPPQEAQEAVPRSSATVPPAKAAAAQQDVMYGEFQEFERKSKPAAAQAAVETQIRTAAPKKRDGFTFSASFEENLGARLPVWVGGIALIFAAFYLVKYSIDAGLLGPEVRLSLGGLFGLALLGGGHMMSRREDAPSMARIVQALIGAGLVSLYICFYSATNIHEFLSPMAGFLGMGAVTAVGVLMSLRHGQPVAVFALVGGLLTPFLVQTDAPNPIALFGYLFVLFAGLMFVMMTMGWWLLAVLALFGMYGWAFLWLLFLLDAGGDPDVLLFFILGLILVCVLFTQKFVRTADSSVPKNREWGIGISLQHILNIVAVAGGFILLTVVNFRVTLDVFDWSALTLISLALIGLSYFKPVIYTRALWLVVAATIGLYAIWAQGQPATEQSMVLAMLVIIYALVPQFLLRRTSDPRSWAMMQAVTVPSLLVIAHWQIDVLPEWQAMFADRFWGLLCLLLAVASAAQAKIVSEQYKADARIRDHLIGTYALGATACLSLGIVFEIPSAHLPLAFAMEIAAVAWVARSVKLESMQKIMGALLLIFAALNYKQILLFSGHILNTLFDETLSSDFVQSTILDNSMLLLGGSAAFLTLAAALNHRGTWWAQSTNNGLIAASVFLVSALLYCAVKGTGTLTPDVFLEQSGFLMRSIITLSFAALAFALVGLSRKISYPVLQDFGIWMFHLVMLRILWFDLIIHNPYFDASQFVLDTPVLNGVTLTYGFGAALAAYFAIRVLGHLKEDGMLRVYMLWFFVLGFSFINFTIRQYFHGGYMADTPAFEAEIYTYSVAWLLFGLVLLFSGVRFEMQSLRAASLAVMVLTVGKVFLYDAASLEGLLRVFSFLGLGLSLIGLSFLYTRYVFKER